MPNLGMPEILILVVVALVIFGPKKLPEFGKSLGQGIREFRKSTKGVTDELKGSFEEEARPVPVREESSRPRA